MLLKTVVLLMMLAIVVSLGSALVFLFRRGKAQSKNMARALTWRIGLSVALFALLMASYYFGIIPQTGLTR